MTRRTKRPPREAVTAPLIRQRDDGTWERMRVGGAKEGVYEPWAWDNAAWESRQRAAEQRRSTMQPYYDHNGICIYHARCEDVMPTLAERPALVLTDPPYGVNFNPGGGNGVTSKTFTSDARVAGDTEPFDPSPLLKLNAPLVLWGANHYADKLPPSSSWLVWYKKDGLPSIDYADCEMAWSNIGGPARIYNHIWHGMIRASERGQRRPHPTTKPVALMRWCLLRAKLAPGALVLDPYMGSGPVAQACKELGYRYIGIELVEEYCARAVCRLSQEVMELV